MAIGEDFAGRQSPFELLLDELESDESPPTGAGVFIGAERLWPRASGPIGGPYFRVGAIESLYAEGQSVLEPAALPEKPATPRLKASLREIETELAAAKDVAELHRLRRRCALAAHPDRVGPLERPLAEKLMSEVNAAIDRAIKDRRFASRKI
jgi:hypothetical protein